MKIPRTVGRERCRVGDSKAHSTCPRSIHSPRVSHLRDKQLGRPHLSTLAVTDIGPPLDSCSLQTAELLDRDTDESAPRFQALITSLTGVFGPVPAAAARKKRVARTTPARKRRTRSPSAGTVEQNPQDALDYVRIPSGKFQMGGVPGDSEAFREEQPRHAVEITRGFWMSRSPVTVAAYRRFADDTERPTADESSINENWAKPDHPIVNVSWEDARDYCEWAGDRLPTEAEWEYAARGGKGDLKYPWGDEISTQNAKYDSTNGTAPVGSYGANGFELYDMSGNVYEWCADWYAEDYYASSPSQDPTGPPVGRLKVMRGGSWNNHNPRLLRCSYRYKLVPVMRWLNIGFRCVREVEI